MRVISGRNVNDLYFRALVELLEYGVFQSSRAGDVIAFDTPVTLVYSDPQQRVLLDEGRDANPFLHLFESLWMLAGRQDAVWLDQFVKDFSSRFAEEDGHQHGAYGYRWRNHFDIEGGGNPNLPDQLSTVIAMLRINPQDRRAVLQMWDPAADLGANKKDVPCNLTVLPRVRGNALDITVFNRSNDVVWGALGANAVHFSVLQEYLAGKLGLRMGVYYQISNNMHGYKSVLSKLPVMAQVPNYPDVASMGRDWGAWDDDLKQFMEWADSPGDPASVGKLYKNVWFARTAQPLFWANHLWKAGDKQYAYDGLCLEFRHCRGYEGASADWFAACRAWMARRLAKAEGKLKDYER